MTSLGDGFETVMSNSYNIAREVRDADLLIGAVLITGARAPQLVTEGNGAIDGGRVRYRGHRHRSRRLRRNH